MAGDWLWMTATDLGRGIADGQINPIDLAEVYLAAMRDHPAMDDIYARPTESRARAEAAAAAKRARLGQRLGPLDGVPISWKDLFDTAGVATEAGSQLLEGRVPDMDAQVIRNATAAGLVCLGKTHMTELAFSGLGLNPMTATPPNRQLPGHAPGGSSSGAAASVRHGLAAAGIGSDTGGSVRIPSAWNDLVGFKPAHGALPLDGVVPLCPLYDTVGPLCRSVEDAALLNAALGGPSPDLRGASLDGTRLLIIETVAMEDVRLEPMAGFDNAVQRLRAVGAVVEHREVSVVREALDLAPVLVSPEAYGTWEHVIEATPDKMYVNVLERFRTGKAVSAARYVAGLREQARLREEFHAEIRGFDAILAPTCPNMPPVVDELMSNSDIFLSENLLALRNTRIANLLWLAAITLPTGLPMTGIMFMSGPGTEGRLLRLAAAAEKALA